MIYLDLEGTGTDVTQDRIVEFCLYNSSARSTPWVERVNPGRPIPAEVTAVHGITDADVADKPPFAAFASAIQQTLDAEEDLILCGYSLRKYDTLLLDIELRRAGQRGLPRTQEGRIAVKEIDLFEIWARSEPRSLVGAAKRFAGVDLVDVHSARADTEVLPGILEGMCREFGLPLEEIALAALSVPEGEVDRDRKFRRREDGVIVFNFGNSRGYPAKLDPGLLGWILRKDFSAETKAVARELLAEVEREERQAWEEQQREREAQRAAQGDVFAATAPEPAPKDLLEDDDLPF